MPRHKLHGETAKKNSFFFCDYFNCIFCQTPFITTSHRHSKNYLCHKNLDIVANITSESCRPALLEDWLECGMCCWTGNSMFYISKYFLSRYVGKWKRSVNRFIKKQEATWKQKAVHNSEQTQLPRWVDFPRGQRIVGSRIFISVSCKNPKKLQSSQLLPAAGILPRARVRGLFSDEGNLDFRLFLIGFRKSAVKIFFPFSYSHHFTLS